MQFTLWSIPPTLAACVALFAFYRSRDRAHAPGGKALRFLFLTVFVWSAAQALETFLLSPPAKLLANQIAWIGIALTPVAWFQFAFTFARRSRRLFTRSVAVVSIIPLITICLVFTNSIHGLIWNDWRVIETDGYHGLVTEFGLWFYVQASYAYALLLISTTILVFVLTQVREHFMAQIAALFAPLLGTLANALYISGLSPVPWLDLTPLAFVAGVILLDQGILQLGLLNHLPILRDQVVEQLSEPVLVINHDGLILDANTCAHATWAEDERPIINHSISQLIPQALIRNLLNTTRNSELNIRGRLYDISSTAMDAQDPRADIALVFRDITERNQSERQLRSVTAELQRMAHTDALTGLYNRRFFMQRLNEEYDRVKRHSSVLSVLIFDLDHFKEVNDRYGHDMGDLVLIEVARIANELKRSTDVACRYGGEEFALLLPETNQDGAMHLAQRLRQRISIAQFGKQAADSPKVTASIGVATLSVASTSIEGILKVADDALYRAKNSGRDNVVAAH